MTNKKVKVQWAIDIEELPSVMRELFYRALNHFNYHDLISAIEDNITQENIHKQLNSIDKMRREMALFDERLADVYSQLFAYQSHLLEEKRQEMLSIKQEEDDYSSPK
jgi:DNA-directed RNA polymerase specialized sigma54-like protein